MIACVFYLYLEIIIGEVCFKPNNTKKGCSRLTKREVELWSVVENWEVITIVIEWPCDMLPKTSSFCWLVLFSNQYIHAIVYQHIIVPSDDVCHRWLKKLSPIVYSCYWLLPMEQNYDFNTAVNVYRGRNKSYAKVTVRPEFPGIVPNSCNTYFCPEHNCWKSILFKILVTKWIFQ